MPIDFHGGYMDDDKRSAALAAAAALLAIAEGADAGAVRARVAKAGSGTAEAFDRHLAHLRENRRKGEMAALQALHPVKGDARAATELMETLLGDCEPEEELAPAQVAAARRVCETLNLSPTRFGL
ncbi:tellurite resistance TerB family protein [Skermanella pratensis]|uniref:tellurite resistance TerB family protein n=1 Tax=Skermanella pratensis TaxID=2233999 RepID=UPI001300DC44|nr:tellurite resistance TerB family protein [Skermanella pratensis]